MPAVYRSPGVYRQDVFLKPEVRLPTGVPGFVGFAGAVGPTEALPAGGPPVNTPFPLHRKDEFASTFVGLPGGFLADAVAGFFDNGGRPPRTRLSTRSARSAR
jgi:uncharacterized protein